MYIKHSRPLVLFGFEGQKLGTLLENKVHLKSKLSKYVFNEKIRRFLLAFDIEKWPWKSEMHHFLPSIPKRTTGLEFVMQSSWSWGQAYSFLNSATLESGIDVGQEINLGPLISVNFQNLVL